MPATQLCWRVRQPCPVGSHPEGKSWAQVEDLAGNVWEWTQSSYCVYPVHGCIDSKERVIRGGSWADTEPDIVQTTYRGHVPPWVRQPTIGFRCVMTAERGKDR
jgi:formylglycine-generating enzyme required for sulfatase activity